MFISGPNPFGFEHLEAMLVLAYQLGFLASSRGLQLHFNGTTPALALTRCISGVSAISSEGPKRQPRLASVIKASSNGYYYVQGGAKNDHALRQRTVLDPTPIKPK
jgi:hypothetical protein